ncbi:MAG: sensor histidine kinase [Leptolyngbya sp. DLM2.Bin27]|nr:MAG: sensor histidine kinase [Leptolyngbya sp. DLM2.Bin27]
MAHPWPHLIHPFRRWPLGKWIDLNSLQTRLTAGVVLASLVAIAAMTTWMGWRTEQILLDSHRQQAMMVADRFAEDVRYYTAMMPADEALQRVIEHRATGDLGIWVTTAPGDLLAQSEILTMGSWQTSGVAADLLRIELDEGVEIRPIQAWQFVVCVEPLSIAGLPNAILHIANDITAEYQGLQRLIQMLWLTGLGMVTLLAVACAWYIRCTLRPIRRLNDLASQVTAKTLNNHQLNLRAAPTEVQELARSYNLMLARLAKAWAQQKRFANDISHELRTPLTLVQGYLESTLRRGSNLTPPQRQGLEIAAVETSRTVHLLTELLDLARIDNGQLVLKLEPVNLEEVMKEAIAMAEGDHLPAADATARIVIDVRWRSLDCGKSPAPIVKADRPKLRSVLVELLDNALRYSAPHQPVQVQLLTQGGWAMVQVHDQGPGIPFECQAAVFDPFYRVDENRSRSTGGSGLGLTLVRSLVEAMAGQVSLRSQPGQGSVFTISLPI